VSDARTIVTSMALVTIDPMMGNPYLTEFQRVRRDPLPRSSSQDDLILWAQQWEDARHDRNRLVNRYSYAIPTPEAIEAIASYSPILEIGAGTGYWAWLLRLARADVVAVDRHPPDSCDNWWFQGSPTWTRVDYGTESWVRIEPDRTLFLCWPPFEGTEPFDLATARKQRQCMAYNALRLYTGDRFIYVGEESWGCCAGWLFWRQIEKRWHVVREVDIPQWEGIHDALYVYERNG
jgi:hypothetical protein